MYHLPLKAFLVGLLGILGCLGFGETKLTILNPYICYFNSDFSCVGHLAWFGTSCISINYTIAHHVSVRNYG